MYLSVYCSTLYFLKNNKLINYINLIIKLYSVQKSSSYLLVKYCMSRPSELTIFISSLNNILKNWNIYALSILIL